MCLRRAPEKYIAGAALDRAALRLEKQHLPGTTVSIYFDTDFGNLWEFPMEGSHRWFHFSMTSVLVGGEWSALSPCHFNPGETAPGYPLDIRLGGPQNRSER
jgi:hypothetical protein